MAAVIAGFVLPNAILRQAIPLVRFNVPGVLKHADTLVTRLPVVKLNALH